MKITNSQKKKSIRVLQMFYLLKKQREGIKDKLGENSKAITEIGK